MCHKTAAKGADVRWSIFLEATIEEGVTLVPIFDDVLGETTRSGLSTFGTQLNELSAELRGFLEPKVTGAGLPIRALWLEGVPYVEEDNQETGGAPLLLSWRGNNSQQKAVQNAFYHKVSVV